tara:strand:- start:179 stop:763 length:585 start_codon:yes stop_codon:yes gene_type:complete
MTDYYKLYEYCSKTFEKKDHKRKQYLANKKARLKKELFVTITQGATNIIKENAEEGFDYAIIYDNEYNELIYDLLDSLAYHFKPFNVIYKKKSNTQRGFFEVLNDETNYVIMVDWKKKSDNEKVETEKVNTNSNSMIYSNISELPSKNILNEEKKLENKILDNSISDEKIEQQNEKENKEEDNIINKFGFETIF